MKTAIYLIRHGETDWNVRGLMQGQTDIVLNNKGLTQAKHAGLILQDKNIAAIYSSPLTRAYQTAKSIALHHKVDITLIDEFKECAFGIFEGITWEEVGAHPQFDARSKKRYPLTYSVPEGESIQDVYDRVIPTLTRIAGYHKNQNIAVVSHGLVMRVIMQHVHNVAHDENKRVVIENARPYLVEYSHQDQSYSPVDFPIAYR
jgi:2,3-bisphosphoglycerate-dependent phosphoglycerate mutase